MIDKFVFKYRLFLAILNAFRSYSMTSTDFLPLPNRPNADLIIRHSNNRLGAVFSSLHAFWVSRSSALHRVRGTAGRKDAYSVIFFDDSATICLQNDTDSTPEQLLRSMLGYTAGGWTNSVAALATAETVMRNCWSDALYVACFYNIHALKTNDFAELRSLYFFRTVNVRMPRRLLRA